MAKKKLGNVNVNTSNMRANVSLDRFDDQIQRAQYLLDSQVMNDMVPYMPQETGTFINVTRAKSAALAGTGLVCAGTGPMGRFLYNAKGMVDELTGSPWARKGAKKVLVTEFAGHTNAKVDLSFSNPKATPKWFETAKKNHGKKWIEITKKEAGGG